MNRLEQLRRRRLPFAFNVVHLAADHAADRARRRRQFADQFDAPRRIDARIFAETSNASVNSASPARIAMASPKTLWQVGRPRRRSSLSSAGQIVVDQRIGVDHFQRAGA